MAKFFTEPRSQQKRKRGASGPPGVNKRKRGNEPATKPDRPTPRDESISGSDSDASDAATSYSMHRGLSENGSDSELYGETGAEKRLRLAEQYLARVRTEVAEDEEAKGDGADGAAATEMVDARVAQRLREDVAESKGKLYRHIAMGYDYSAATAVTMHAPPACTTAVAACVPFMYTGDKRGVLTKWEIPVEDLAAIENAQRWFRATGHRPRPFRRRPIKLASTTPSRDPRNGPAPRRTAAILAVAASPDGRLVAVGGADRRLIVYSTTAAPTASGAYTSRAAHLQPLRAFAQHRDAVTGLAFSRASDALYSASADRTVKTWATGGGSSGPAYVETLFGHQDRVLDAAALAPDRCVTAGARDRTVRLWKVAEETQLVFRGGGAKAWERDAARGRRGDGERDGAEKAAMAEGSIERVACVDDETFVSGSDGGALALWSVFRKKPVCVVPAAHGRDPSLRPEQAYAEQELEGRKVPAPPQPRWITALVAVPYADLVLSGSWDGRVRAWRVSEDRKRLEALGALGEVEPPDGTATDAEGEDADAAMAAPAHGVINDLAVLETGKRGAERLLVVAAVGREHRLGRWHVKEGRSGALLFEVPRLRPERAAAAQAVVDGEANEA